MFILILAILVTIVSIYFDWNRAKIKGKWGERAVQKILSALPDKYVTFNNIYIKTENRTTQIDHIVFSPYGIFVIETKNYKGWIFGSEQSEFWEKSIYGNRYKFRNPLKQNYSHIFALHKILSLPQNKFISIVVFIDKYEVALKGGTGNLAIYSSQLYDKIFSYQNILLSQELVDDAVSRLKNFIIQDDDIEKYHNISINQYIREKNNLINQGICPRCRGKLVERNGKYGSFIGCSNYPNCKFTKDI